MEGIIKVETSKLRQTANEFGNVSTQIRNLTSNMVQTVNQLTGTVWSGDAATAYITKFKSLDDDMTKIDRMIQEHVNDLTQMAAEYERAEQANQQQAGAFKSDAF
ncbi:MAG: WXG100 family type VII secretion target [Mogibacterium sp.]|nr:WXG100 family type VII secretion target [Mogibacterium sp.]